MLSVRLRGLLLLWLCFIVGVGQVNDISLKSRQSLRTRRRS